MHPRPFARSVAVVVATVALLVSAPAASASVSSTWGWTTDTLTMSFFGGIPYYGCEKAFLKVPNSGSTGSITSTTRSSIAIGAGAVCLSSTLPSSLNANTIRTNHVVLRNGYILSNCTTGTAYNSSGQGSISVSTGSGCTKTSSTDAIWTILGHYGWWDYDDVTWRSEWVALPTITD